MGDQRESGIAWTDETWNPIRGCTRVSPGCEHCYAEAVAARFSGPGLAYEGLAERRLFVLQDGTEELRGRWTGEVRLVREHLADPLRWRRPRRVFVNSMSDLFHEKLPNETIAAIFGVMAAAPQHTFQVLTKRPERMRAWFDWIADEGVSRHPLGAARGVRWFAWDRLSHIAGAAGADHDAVTRDAEACAPTWSGTMPAWLWPLPNVWLGVTAEDQQRADERVPLLMRTPAAARFVSVEPQLGHVDLSPWLGYEQLGSLDWVITGAESGHGARPYDLAWARSLRDQCAGSPAAFFLKQTIVGGKKVSTPELDGRRWADFPEAR